MMAVYRSRSAAPHVSADGAAATRSQAELNHLLDKIREEGRQLGLREAAAQVVEAKRLRGELDQLVAKKEKELSERLTPVFEALSASLEDLENLEAQLVQSSEAETVRLALAIAERVVFHHIDTDPAWMRDLLNEARRRLPDRRRVVIRLHPDDAAPARAHLAGMQASGSGGQLEILDDAGLPRGGAILQSEGTTLDAGVSGAMSRLGERLLQAAPRPDGFVAVGRAAEVADHAADQLGDTRSVDAQPNGDAP
jgi:flagellar biosynthesis/type III secretory pathway protein FliH